jgi:methyl-accepting chemotaxis protein
VSKLVHRSAAAARRCATVVTGVHRVEGTLGDVSNATRAESEEIESVDGAIVQLDEMTLQNAVLVAETSAASGSSSLEAGCVD